MKLCAASLVPVLSVALLCSCVETEPAPGCTLPRQALLDGSPATLLKEPRLDRVGGSFVLLGVDSDGDIVRWATLGADGKLGVEGSVAVPPHVAGPWFASAGAAAAGDRIIVAFAVAKAGTPPMVEVRTFSVGRDGTGATAPALLVDVPDPVAMPVQIAMGSSHSGMRAGFAWAPRAQSTVLQAVLIGGDARQVGGTIALNMLKDIDCLAFMPATTDLAVGFFDLDAPGDTSPDWRIVQIRDGGQVDLNVGLGLDTDRPRCPVGTPTPTGYAIAWQNDGATSFATYDTPSNQVIQDVVVGAVRWGGAAAQPPIGGLASVGKQFALVFERSFGPEVWRFDSSARRQGGALVLPSAEGKVGRVASAPVLDGLVSTYSDHPATGTGGRRQFMRTECK